MRAPRLSLPPLETIRLPLGGAHRRAPGWRAVWGPALLVIAAIASAFVPCGRQGRAALALALVAAAAALHHALRRGVGKPPAAWVVVDGRGVHRVERHRTITLAEFSEPVGLTVFSSVDRATLRVALTTPRAARYVGARVHDAADAASAHTLLERATTVADEDLRGGSPGWLSAADAQRLIDAVSSRLPGALDRAYLSSAAGEPVILERAELRVGSRRFDLTAPIEWRPFLFQELGAHSLSVCQATWVRQADVEVVLVASVSSEGAKVRETHAAVRAAGEAAVVRRSLAQDVRLMQASASDPPPRELRCAIDRTFMLPIRHALDRAPRASRAALPAARAALTTGQGPKLG
jgi:hypothetical protein